MDKYEFQVILADVSEMTEEISNALYEAGCDDGTPFSSGGVAVVGFTRAAPSLDQAIRSAIADIEKSGHNVDRVESTDEPIFSRINEELARE